MKQKKSIISPYHSLSQELFVLFENSWVVSENAKYVIGVNGKNPTRILLFNMGTQSTFGIELNKGFITSLIYDENSQTLFAGDWAGHLIHYEIDWQNSSIKKLMKYKNLEIGRINSSVQFKGVLFFGGNDSKIKVFNLSDKFFFFDTILTSISLILSLEVSVVEGNKFFLSVSGSNADYSEEKSDLFDLKKVLESDRIHLSQYPYKDIVESNKTVLRQEEKIKKMTLEIEKYKAMESKYKRKKSRYNQDKYSLKQKVCEFVF